MTKTTRCPKKSRRKSDGKCHKNKTLKKKNRTNTTKKSTKNTTKKSTKNTKKTKTQKTTLNKNKIDRDYKKLRKEIKNILEKDYPSIRKAMVKDLKPKGIKITGTKKEIIDLALHYIESGSIDDSNFALEESIWKHRIEL